MSPSLPFSTIALQSHPRLEISLQVSPAPLQSAEAPVHTGPVAVNHAAIRFANQALEHVGGAAGATGKEGEGAGDDGPDPALGRAFLRRRFIDVDDLLRWQLLREF